MDESDRRAVARERERAKRRVAQAPADVAPEAMQARVKRWTETLDRFFQILESELRKKLADEPNG